MGIRYPPQEKIKRCNVLHKDTVNNCPTIFLTFPI